MSALRRWLLRIWTTFRKGKAERDLAREMAAHLALLEDDYRSQGLSPEAARLAARRAFGGVEQAKELQRAERAVGWIEDLRSDVRYAARTLCKAPGFTGVAVLTLALGIGMAGAIFGVVHSVLLEPLPYRNAERLARLVEHVPGAETEDGQPRRRRVSLSVPELVELRSRTRVVRHAGIENLSFVTVSGGESTTRLEGLRVSPAIFSMLGVQPLIGRVLDQGDEAAGAEPVMVIGYGAWRQHFGGECELLGRRLLLDDVFARQMVSPDGGAVAYTVVGVMPETFEYGRAQFWVPNAVPATDSAPTLRGSLQVELAEGVAPQEAADQLGTIVTGLRASRSRGSPEMTSPGPEGGAAPRRFELVLWQDALVESVRSELVALLAAAGFLLLIACVNVANLMFARTAVRNRELAIRAALGAGRGRVIRLLVTESVLLAVLAGIVGTLLTAGGFELWQSLGTTLARMDLGIQLPFPRLHEIGLDRSVLLFVAATSLGAGVVCGLGPAFRHAGSSGLPSARSHARSVLVVAETALAMMLLVGGGLVIRSFAWVSAVPLGFDPTHVLTFQVALPTERYPSRAQARFADTLVERLGSIPRVEAAAYARQLPFVALVEGTSFRRTPEPPSERGPDWVDARLVSRDYVRVMGVPVIEGRDFRDTDGAGQPRVLLVNSALARREFPSGDAVGRIVYVGQDTVPWEIVGVVDDVRQLGHEIPPDPQMFAQFVQWPEANGLGFTFLGPYYAVRIEGDPSAAISDIRAAARRLEPTAGLYNVASMEDLVANHLSRPRMYSLLFGLFAGLGVVLASTGLYGVLAYTVAQRTHEIGIRMALGARHRSVWTLVVGQSLVLTAGGIVLGLAGAATLARALERLLFGFNALDPTTYAAVTAVFVVVALGATVLPARRATEVDPLVALRHE